MNPILFRITKNPKNFVAICFLLMSFQINAQQVFQFQSGLASGMAHRYGRDAMYADTFAYALNAGKITVPIAGKVWYESENRTKTWVPVQADSAGVFRSQAMNNGYLCLTYTASKAQSALLTISGHAMAYFNGEAHAGDQYRYGYMRVPVLLKKGLNAIYVRSGFSGRFGGVKASLELGGKPIRLSAADATLPFLVQGLSKDKLWAGIVCLNSMAAAESGLSVDASYNGLTINTVLPTILSLGSRKMPVQLPVPDNIQPGNEAPYLLTLKKGNKILDTLTVRLSQVSASQHQAHTFISKIDGSVQYYAVAPQAGGPTERPALFLSVHGAEVEAIGQARAYKPKAEGTLVAPTNRRPRGFNWEDWGRLDALEVLEIAKQNYKPDNQKIYLTGHSMGGHGTWFLGATYAGQWAGIAPCAGYPVLQSYGSADGLIPTEAGSPMRKNLIRASNPSNVLAIARNYKAAGVYIHHGDNDRTVSVNYARQMRGVLSEFHPDFAYYEYPGGGHWFGDISVDWPPLFDFFKHHTNLPSGRVHELDFSTANPSISHTHYWLQVLQQQKSFEYSRVKLVRDTAKLTITGSTENVQAMAIQFDAFKQGDEIAITLDDQVLKTRVNSNDSKVNLKKQAGQWAFVQVQPALTEKGIQRGGGLKEAFNHKMVFVYGTSGTAEENNWAIQKARYDAETWYYRGNGAVDLIADTKFDEASYAGRGVVLYGNAQTNKAYNLLLEGCELRLERGRVTVGSKVFEANDLGVYFVWPRKDNPSTAVAVVGGTGIVGMRAADANQYFAGGSGFPDFMIFSANMMIEGEKALKATGYFDYQWKLGDDWVSE